MKQHLSEDDFRSEEKGLFVIQVGEAFVRSISPTVLRCSRLPFATRYESRERAAVDATLLRQFHEKLDVKIVSELQQ